MKSSNKRQELKTVRIGLKTSIHDTEVKASLADKFLKKGDQVRLEIFLKGREKAFRDLARTKLIAFEKMVTEQHKTDGSPTSSPSGWSITIHK